MIVVLLVIAVAFCLLAAIVSAQQSAQWVTALVLALGFLGLLLR